MSDVNTIDLRPAMMSALRTGKKTIGVADNTGRRVFLFTKAGWPSDRIPGPQPSVVLSAADLDLIEQEQEGLGVADTTRTTGWTVRMAQVSA